MLGLKNDLLEKSEDMSLSMNKHKKEILGTSITILDKEYKNWIKTLSSRYRKSQIKAALKVNDEMLHFYYDLGKDIVSMKSECKWGSGFMKNLSSDLKEENPEATCFSPTNLLYMKNFYLLYLIYLENAPQVVEKLENKTITPQVGEKNPIFPQLGEKIENTKINQQLVEQIATVEVKIGEFDFADVGQLGGYVVSCNHLLRKEGRDNPTIGLLVCKQKDNLVAQYALESSSQPLGISEYELAKLYPEKIDGTMPTIEELEQGLADKEEMNK